MCVLYLDPNTFLVNQVGVGLAKYFKGFVSLVRFDLSANR